jgi:ribosomal protein L11 methyltransferase
MSPRPNLLNNQASSSTGPYQELFIYYLKGRLKKDGQTLPDGCIGNWEEEEDSFLFFSRPALEQVNAILSRQPQLSYIDSYHMPYAQWLGEVFSTFEHGIFRVIPPWEASQNSINNNKTLSILLDPGLVFGTGTHPTTRDCLDALELAAGSSEFKTVLDLGTGTGLLALAAAKLGSQGVIACDLNLLAAKTAHRNVRLNHQQNRIVTVQGRAEDMIAYPADLVIANIHYDVMRRLVDDRGFLSKKRFILSGLLRSEAKNIADILAGHRVNIIKQWTHEGIWYTFYGEI